MSNIESRLDRLEQKVSFASWLYMTRWLETAPLAELDNLAKHDASRDVPRRSSWLRSLRQTGQEDLGQTVERRRKESRVRKAFGKLQMTKDPILPQITRDLWQLANIPPSATAGSVSSQRRALRLLLEIRGGAEFVMCRPADDLMKLSRDGVWEGPIVLRALAGLELQRRRLVSGMAHVDQGRRRLFRDLKVDASTIATFLVK